jgi:hypothetical protein
MTESKSSGGTGHCLCGAVQYRCEGEPLTIGGYNKGRKRGGEYGREHPA